VFETDTSVHDLEAPPPESVDDSFEHREILPEARKAIERGTPLRLRREVRNVDLAVGGQLSYEIVQRHGPEGLPDDTIVLDLHGSAGQSLGAWLAIRNSGADAVVEGIGDHGCEYMTGGRVVVLGDTGENFGAGMSGGYAWVHDPDGKLAGRTNHELVDLEPVTRSGAEPVRELVEEHVRRTGSARGAALLERWDEAATEFTLVISRAYKKVLAERERVAEEAEGIVSEAAARMDEAAA
jgi:glutamate synthase domain-containing protein 3